MMIVRTVVELRAIVAGWKKRGHSVGIVPTMGALHDGHLSLVDAALAATDRVIVTLFVNPKQFNNAGDLAAYPKTEASDAAKLKPRGAHVLYAPNGAEMYPAGFATTVSVSGVSDGLCGAARPGHFDGVATVVTKLFTQSGADKAFFGEKDYQQLRVVQRLVTDLDLPIEIVPCQTVREADGLAMSSRNQRLTADQRTKAPELARAMRAAVAAIQSGAVVASALADARQRILDAGFATVDYIELRAADDLSLMDRLDRPARLLAAAFLGEVRLIDNIAVENMAATADFQPLAATG